MDNGPAKVRDLLSPEKGLNEARVSPWWPLQLFYAVVVIILHTTLIRIKRSIMYLFKQRKSLKGKVILVTGAGRGLGRGISVKLAAKGAHVACLDINTKNNEETARLIREQGGVAQAFTCNIAKSEQIEQVKKCITNQMGPVDILINNAALVMSMKIDDFDYDDIRGMYEVNAMGPVFVTKAFLPEMMERNSGHILAVSSVGAWTCSPYLHLYCSTKAAVTQFFECIRVELDINKNNNIVVTVVHPYFINTSADYTNSYHSPFPILNENYVSDSIVDAVQYEKGSVAVPIPLSILKVLDAIAPTCQYNIAMDYFSTSVNILTKKMREQLPYSSIIKDSVKSD